ncbi:predicted protein [Naegleria gruberi]|uniref:Predicted protein n=1 Tax=Naegleria gruberi TaxID=5762 RepID=D2VYR1_NAEGR|nr:uncharacterized protein NAEGRDRAFT_74210 [Naegleria gruberi]EFC37956.1 predicted protein [Naegleria gruberi]|eukprot:XP_002670700.1 predicted protein [Naegleria gruberi strain NEG-M]
MMLNPATYKQSSSSTVDANTAFPLRGGTTTSSDFSDTSSTFRRPSADVAAFSFNTSNPGRNDEISDSVQSSTESMTATSSFINHTKENILTMLVSLQERAPVTGWKNYIFYLMFYIYVLWCQLFVPTVRNFNWGEEGKYVFKVINFPTTLLFDLVPYFGTVGIAAVFMFIVLLTAVLLCSAYYFTIKPSKHAKYVTNSLWYLSFCVKIFALIGTHLLAGFFDCNLSNQISITVSSTSGTSTSTLMSSLNRFSNVGCIESNNDIVIAFSSLTIIVLVIIYPFVEYTTSNCNPQSRLPLTSESSFLWSVLGVCNIIDLVISQSIPIQYSYIAASIHIVISIACCLVIFKSLSFFTHYENAIIQSIYVGRTAVSIGSLISSLSNSGNNSELGGGFVGLAIGLLIIGAVIGFLIQFLILFFRMKQIKNFIIQNSQTESKTQTDEDNLKQLYSCIERMSSVLYADLEDSKRLNSLNMFLKLSLKQGDARISFHFVKGLAQSKMFNNPKALIYSALLVQLYWSEEQSASTLANSFLRKALKNDPSPLERLVIQERIKEVETMSNTKNSLFEIAGQIQKLERYQTSILTLHKDLWKELANEHLNYDSIQKINRNISSLTSECKSTLNSLYFNYKNNKTVIRVYAHFIENFEFNKPLADSLFAEANSLEEEEIKRRRRPSQSKSTKKSLYAASNRVVPNDKYEISSAFHEESSNYDVVENAKIEEMDDAFDNPQIKKETLFLNAISIPKSNSLVRSLSTIYFVFVFVCIVASISLGVIYSYNVKSTVPYVEQVCFPGTVPYALIRSIRACQNWMNTFYFQEVEWPVLNEGYPTITKTVYINDHKNRMNNSIIALKKLIAVGQLGVFTDSIYNDYSSSVYTVNSPTEDSTTPKLYTGTYQTRNTSIVDITNSLIKYAELMMNDYPQSTLLKLENKSLSYNERQLLLNQTSQMEYFNPLTNFNFNYLWANKGTFTTAYEAFCTKYLDSSISIINESVQQFMIYTVSILGIFMAVSFVFLTILLIELASMKKIIKLFERNIKKDIVGKIFHTISAKIKSETVSNSNSLSMDKIKPNLVIIISTLIVLLAACGCIALIFSETYLNSRDSVNIMTRVRLSIQTAVSVERVAFFAQEYYTYFGAEQFTSPTASLRYLIKRPTSFGDMRLWQVRSRFDALVSRVNDGVATASDYMSKLIYGSTDLNLEPIMGIYPSVDKIISIGTDNCTEYMKQNGIAYTYASFKLYCQGLETVFSDFATTAPQLVTDSRRHYAMQQTSAMNGTLLDPFALAMRTNNLLRLSLPLITKYTTFIKEFVKASSSPVVVLTISSACLGISIILICWFIYGTMISNFWTHVHSFRLMLNYVPIDVLDHNEKLRAFALYNKMDGKTETRAKRNTNSEEDEYYNLKVVFNSSVEGTMICSENGEIELFNSSGLRMFGSKSIDILGTSMFDLFDIPCRDVAKRTVAHLVNQCKEQRSDEENANVEILDIEFLRKNQTKFPAKVTIYAVQFAGKTTNILVTFKDVTSEKKSNMLLSDEKKKSDNLLKNILPNQVANRLKSGETFIAEKFDDITCFFSDM